LGLILLGFGGSEYTRNYALSYIKALVHIGFKLFLVTVIIYVGAYSFTRTTGGMVGSAADSLIQTCMTLIGQSFLFVALIKVIPQIADTLIAGVSMSMAPGGYAIRGGAMAATGLAVGTMSAAYNLPGNAASATGGGISAAQSAASAYSGSFNSYKSQGLNNIRAGVSALGSAIWSGYQASRGNPGVGNSMAGINPDASASTASSVSSATSAGNPTKKSSSEAPEPRREEQASAKAKAKPAYAAPTPEELSKKFKSWD
jgi:type IV secretion system protein TrbL